MENEAGLQGAGCELSPFGYKYYKPILGKNNLWEGYKIALNIEGKLSIKGKLHKVSYRHRYQKLTDSFFRDQGPTSRMNQFIFFLPSHTEFSPIFKFLGKNRYAWLN